MVAQKPVTLDVREIPPRERHPLIFKTFDDLTPGEAFILMNDHEPKPLLYQFQFERTGIFEWSPLEEGPEVWRVEIKKRDTLNGSARAVGEFLKTDHRRLDKIFSDHHRPAIETREWVEGLKAFTEFQTGLRRHIRMEEEVLFSEFEERSGIREGGPTDVMRMEHQEIMAIMDDIRRITEATVNNPAEGVTLTKDLKYLGQSLAQLLYTHNQKEERILYPHSDTMMSEEERDAVVRKMQII
jgi:uncharacterized protein (DUF2249 family)/iron-sulfur cluster repair protein YtfE (RIC family)